MEKPSIAELETMIDAGMEPTLEPDGTVRVPLDLDELLIGIDHAEDCDLGSDPPMFEELEDGTFAARVPGKTCTCWRAAIEELVRQVRVLREENERLGKLVTCDPTLDIPDAAVRTLRAMSAAEMQALMDVLDSPDACAVFFSFMRQYGVKAGP